MEEAVRAVAHAPTCFLSAYATGSETTVYAPSRILCTCDRDARIAKGIEAALQADGEMTAIDASNETCDAAALAAFKETP
jgi:hypothetical protein